MVTTQIFLECCKGKGLLEEITKYLSPMNYEEGEVRNVRCESHRGDTNDQGKIHDEQRRTVLV